MPVPCASARQCTLSPNPFARLKVGRCDGFDLDELPWIAEDGDAEQCARAAAEPL
jgi:hypothetical protein